MIKELFAEVKILLNTKQSLDINSPRFKQIDATYNSYLRHIKLLNTLNKDLAISVYDNNVLEANQFDETAPSLSSSPFQTPI